MAGVEAERQQEWCQPSSSQLSCEAVPHLKAGTNLQERLFLCQNPTWMRLICVASKSPPCRAAAASSSSPTCRPKVTKDKQWEHQWEGQAATGAWVMKGRQMGSALHAGRAAPGSLQSMHSSAMHAPGARSGRSQRALRRTPLHQQS